MAAGERVITQRELNRALLARQLLIDRAGIPIPAALERMAGLQAQYAPSIYIGLWSRIADLDRGAVTAALERRTVVQGTLLRSTIHAVAAGDYWPFALAVRHARRDWLLRVRRELDDAGARAAAERLRAAFADGPLTSAEVDGVVGKTLSGNVGLWLDIVRVPPSGTWERRRADRFHLAEAWIGPPSVEDVAAAEEHLVRRYLGGFGPSSTGEIATWAGLQVRTVEAVLSRLRLRRFRAENGDLLHDVPRAPIPPPDTDAPVRFLPTWDAMLLVHARRAVVIAEEDRPRIFSTKVPQSRPTFMVDGLVAGTWKYDKGAIRVDPWRPLSVTTRRAVDDEAERLAAFHRG